MGSEQVELKDSTRDLSELGVTILFFLEMDGTHIYPPVKVRNLVILPQMDGVASITSNKELRAGSSLN